MPLSTGTRLGPYEIVSPLGAGGMGEVYRARDTRLDRTVAVKVLSSHLSSNQELKQRFEREAKAISSFNHPHICTLHDVGSQDGVDYLVMEFLEGQTLADRLARGALPLDQVLKIGAEIAEALEKAHSQGIIHRDLKPGNIMLTKSGAKLMDFGLATPTAMANPAAATPLAHSTPTMSMQSLGAPAAPLTKQGSVLGTYQYIAPEVVQGNKADARSDIFALGIVLYEMATGQHAFPGKTTASVIANILERDPPPISSVQPISPPVFDALVQICLAKDPEERWQTAHDVKLQLGWAAANALLPANAAREPSRLAALGWLTAALLLLSLAALGIWRWRVPQPAEAVPVLSFVPAPLDTRLLSFGFGAGPAVVSPDGTKLAFSAISKDSVIKLWVRPVGSREASAVPGTEDAAMPFWSADSGSLGFFAETKVKTVNLSTGSVDVLCDAASTSSANSGSWSRNGTILFSDTAGKPLRTIPTTGGQPVSLTPLQAGDTYESYPSFLPDGDHFLYEAGNNSGSRIEMASLSSGSSKQLLTNAHRPSYAGGYLFFLRGSKVFAQPFNPGSGILSGTAVPLSDAASYSVGGTVLAFQKELRDAHLQWFDLDGNAQQVIGTVAWYLSPKVSPDGKQVMAVVETPEADTTELVSMPARGGVSTRLTLGPGWKNWSVWSPDGKYFAYGEQATDGPELLRKRADGSGAEEVLLKLGPDARYSPVIDWSPDGRYLSYDVAEFKEPLFKNWILPLSGDRKPFQVSPSSASQFDGNFSPDGHWLAYFSFETGRPEVFVVPFPGPGGKYQISSGGGWDVRWAKGNRLFFLTTGNRLMEADLTLTPQSLRIDSIRPLFQLPLVDVASPMFDVSPDGKRVILVTPASPEANAIGLLSNWQALAKAK